MAANVAYPCPACGFQVFDEPPGSYAICPICGWEDDHVQLRYPYMRGGANSESLFEHQHEVLKTVPLNVVDRDSYIRDPSWRPLDEADHQLYSQSNPETGSQYFESAAEESPDYYWKH
jgi:hypothetical protein